jgi:hypothetical protein
MAARKQPARKKVAKRKPSARKTAAKRELISPRGNKRYVRRDAKGRIKDSVDVGRSLSADRRRKAGIVVKAARATAATSAARPGLWALNWPGRH